MQSQSVIRNLIVLTTFSHQLTVALVVVLTGFTVGVNIRVGQATLPIVHPTVTGVFTVIFDQVIKATCKMTFVAAIPNTRKKIIATNSEQ